MTDNTKEKNYVGSLIRLHFNDGEGEVETLYTVMEQDTNNNKVTLARTDTGKEMVITIKYMLANDHFQVL